VLDQQGQTVVELADLIISTDASMTGWGATDQNTSTGGVWTALERAEHIEIMAVKLALQALVKRSSTSNF